MGHHRIYKFISATEGFIIKKLNTEIPLETNIFISIDF